MQREEKESLGAEAKLRAEVSSLLTSAHSSASLLTSDHSPALAPELFFPQLPLLPGFVRAATATSIIGCHRWRISISSWTRCMI